jgi:glutathione S-transferase
MNLSWQRPSRLSTAKRACSKVTSQKHPYLVGRGLTLADFSVAARLFFAEKAELPLTPYPHIRDWFARVSSLPAWRDTAPAAAAA